MTQFDDRKKAQEAKFARDGELMFKAVARRNKLIGMWAAVKMGLSGAEAEAYAKSVVVADFERPGHDDVVEKLLADLQPHDNSITEAAVRRQMDVMLEEAQKQLLQENAG